MRPLRVLTWPGRGNFLRYLTRVRAEFIVPVEPNRFARARLGRLRLGPNVHEVPADLVRGEQVDCVLYPAREHYDIDGPAVLTPAQRRRLPRIYFEPDPPSHPADDRHWSDDPDGVLVFATPFASGTWNAGRTPTQLIEYGVAIPDSCRYRGTKARGVALLEPGETADPRRAGLDLLDRLARRVPIDRLDAAGDLRRTVAEYRFLINPARWGGLTLATIEALAAGVPVAGLASAELAAVIRSGESGLVAADAGLLAEALRELIADPLRARRLGSAGRELAAERFALDRFVAEWEELLAQVTGRTPGRIPAMAA